MVKLSATRKAIGVAVSGIAFNTYAYIDAGHFTKGIAKGLVATAVGVLACYGLTNDTPSPEPPVMAPRNPQGTGR